MVIRLSIASEGRVVVVNSIAKGYVMIVGT